MLNLDEVLSYNKELETEKLMKEKEQKLRDDFKGVDLAKTTRETRYKKEHGASLVTSVILATKRRTKVVHQRHAFRRRP